MSPLRILPLPARPRFAKLVLSLAAAGLVGPAASAQSVTLRLDNAEAWPVLLPNQADPRFNRRPAAGLKDFTVTAETGWDFPTSLSLFSAELTQNVRLYSSDNRYELKRAPAEAPGPDGARSSLGGLSADRVKKLEVLYAHVFGSSYAPQALTLSERAAFQLAVWDIVHHLGLGHPLCIHVAGQVDPSTQPTAQARLWLQWVEGNVAEAPLMTLSLLHSPTRQDFLIPEAYYAQTIPEPGAYALVAGVIAFAAALRRRGPAVAPPLASRPTTR